jgi:hypothetical protein
MLQRLDPVYNICSGAIAKVQSMDLIIDQNDTFSDKLQWQEKHVDDPFIYSYWKRHL